MITVLSGSNADAISEKLAEIKATFIKKHSSAGIEIFSGDQIQAEQLSSLLAGATLFALERLIIIRGISENKPVAEQLVAQLKNVSDQTHLVLVESQLDKRTVLYKTLKKEAEFYEFSELDEAAASNWAVSFAKSEGGSLTSSDARVLIQYVGTNQARLRSELQKLVLYNPTITKEHIELLVDKRPEDTIFQLLEYALSGKTDKALEVLGGLERAHEDPFQIASMVVWQTNILAVVHSVGAVSDSEIAKSTKINPFVVRKTKDLARKMNRTKLQSILDTVADCDVTLKSSATSPWRVLERTILAL